MSKMDLLITTLATALDVPAGVVVSRWTALRRAKEWTPAVRGTPRPDPIAYDAGRLLISFMAGDIVAEAADTVRRLRASTKVEPKHITEGYEPLPIVGVDIEACSTLGGMLGGVLAVLQEHGALRVEPEAVAACVERTNRGASIKSWPLEERGRITHASVVIARGPIGWSASLTFDAQVLIKPDVIDPFGHRTHPDGSDKTWTIRYECIRASRMERAVLSHAAPDRRTEERVTYRTLKAIGAALRGDDDAARAALSWQTRIFSDRLRHEFLDPEYVARVDISASYGTIRTVEPDYEWLQWVIDNSAQPELWAPEEPTPELMEMWLASARAVLDRRPKTVPNGNGFKADTKARRLDRDRRHAARRRRR
jgi:hypothetical protein